MRLPVPYCLYIFLNSGAATVAASIIIGSRLIELRVKGLINAILIGCPPPTSLG